MLPPGAKREVIEPPPAGSDPLDLSDGILSGIGYLSVRWAILEETVSYATALVLAAQTERYFAVSANMTFSAKVKAARSVAAMAYGATSNLCVLLGQTDELAGLRNKMLHGVWRTTRDRAVAVVQDRKAQGTLRITWDAVSEKELCDIGNRIGLLKDALAAELSTLGLLQGDDSEQRDSD